MQISRLRQELQDHLVDFVWSQWGQMGMLASSSRTDPWAADPEALLLLTFEIGREEPRLFDETLDWLLVNERLVSLHRLRNLAVGEEDQALSRAVIQWLGQWRRKNEQQLPAELDSRLDVVPLFLRERIPVERADPAFRANGFLKSWHEPARRSVQPDLRLPINFAFRMRSLLGVGARAEVVRVLLTVDAPALSLQAIAASSGFNKRNVQEAAAALRAAGAANSWTLGNEQRFDLPREAWLQMLSLDRPPLQVDWPQLFHALRLLLRWLRDPETEHLSDYMRASNARELVEEMSKDLLFAGRTAGPAAATGDEYWSAFEAWVRELAATLG